MVFFTKLYTDNPIVDPIQMSTGGLPRINQMDYAQLAKSYSCEEIHLALS